MRYLAEPNLILESLIYLGLRASKLGPELLEKRLIKMGCTDLAPFHSHYAPFRQLLEQLDRETAPPEEDVIRDFLVSLDLGQEITEETDCAALLKKKMPELPLTKRSRKTLLDALRNYGQVLAQTAACLRPVYAAFLALLPTLKEIARGGSAEMSSPEMERYLRENSVFQLTPGAEYTIRPLLIDPCSNLFFETGTDGPVLYCGLMQQFMRQQQQMASGSREHICECLHLLGDPTRFEIFCYLRERPAYGQELSERFGLARNTIHYHMTKLFDVGLVRCMVKGACVYYSIDEAHFSHLLDHQRALFLPHYRGK